jgi:hypothetical protein
MIAEASAIVYRIRDPHQKSIGAGLSSGMQDLNRYGVQVSEALSNQTVPEAALYSNVTTSLV